MTNVTNAEELERAAEKVRNRLSGKKQVFPVRLFPEERVVDWYDDDIDDFLNLCERSQGALTYISEERIKQEDADEYEILLDHIGEQAKLEVAFLQDGYFHRFSMATDWWIDFCESLHEASLDSTDEGVPRIDKHQAAEIGACLVGLEEGDIAEGFIKRLKESDHPSATIVELLYEYVCKEYGLPSSSLWNLREVNSAAYETFKNLSATVEEKVVDSLLPTFIEWARNNRRKRLLKVDTELFLNENHIKLSKESILVLWRRGSYSLEPAKM